MSLLDARTGMLLRSVPLGTQATSSPNSPIAAPAINGRTGRVYVLLNSPTDDNSDPTGPGTLAVLDARTGAVRRRVNLGDTVSASSGRTLGLAVDARTNHVFVLTTYSVRIYDASALG